MAESENTLLGNDIILQLGDGNSPEAFTDFCAIFDAGQIGETKPQVDVTGQCDLVRVFRGGLPEGAEFTVQANFIQGDAQTRDMYTRYKANENVSMRLNVLGSSPPEYFQLRAAILGWAVVKGANGERAAMTFTLKISGEIEWVYT